MIYENKEKAEYAQNEFYGKLAELEAQYGANFEVDDSCVEVLWTMKYYDENRKICILY